MKITKYEHACLDLEVDGKRLLIDPGTFTTSIPNFDQVAVVVVTHAHADHLDTEKLRAIGLQNPDVQIFAVQQVADEVKGELDIQVVTNGYKVDTAGFQLEFFGTDHAIIHESLPKFQNAGILVNKTLYYPGDSFTLPHAPIDVLAVPISAPWLKMSEVMDFVTAVKPKRMFATHDAILSELGVSVSDRYLPLAGEKVGAQYIPLKPGSSLSV